MAWQADRLQRQVSALQEEREALAQHLDRMQEALVAARERGEAAQTGLENRCSRRASFSFKAKASGPKTGHDRGTAMNAGKCGEHHQRQDCPEKSTMSAPLSHSVK